MRVYDNLFHRLPDPGGLALWTNAIRSGAPRVGVANAITSSAEFRSGLISAAYDRYLGRGPDPAGLQFWLGQMAAGMTIEQSESTSDRSCRQALGDLTQASQVVNVSGEGAGFRDGNARVGRRKTPGETMFAFDDPHAIGVIAQQSSGQRVAA